MALLYKSGLGSLSPSNKQETFKSAIVGNNDFAADTKFQQNMNAKYSKRISIRV